MPFHFKQAESPGEAVPRICRERLAKARARLRHSGQPAVVHGVRKDIKKLRALFRLVRGEIGRDAYRKRYKVASSGGQKAGRAAGRAVDAQNF